MDAEITVSAHVRIPDNVSFIEDSEGTIVGFERDGKTFKFWLGFEVDERDATSDEIKAAGIEVQSYFEHSLDVIQMVDL